MSKPHRATTVPTAKTSTYINPWTLPPWPIESNVGAWGQLRGWITVASIKISHVTPLFGLLQSLTNWADCTADETCFIIKVYAAPLWSGAETGKCTFSS